MLTIQDHHTGCLFDPWSHLGGKRRRLLENSWAGVFREYLLRALPVTELAPHFSEGVGRPSKDLYVACGALILQQLHDLTDRQAVEAIALNLAWHYALDIRRERDAYLCERTLRNYRRLIIEKQLDEVIFRTLTDRLIVSIGAGTDKQRLDSTAVRSHMRTLTRLGIVVEAVSKFLRECKRRCPDLFEQVDAELWRKYVKREGGGCFASSRPSESKRRLPEAAQDLCDLVGQFRHTAASQLESFLILERVLDEQCEVDDEETKGEQVDVKAPKDVPCDGVLNPADPDASYNTRRGAGYCVQMMETFADGEAPAADGDEKETATPAADPPDLITHVAIGKMTEHDRWALVPALEDTRTRGVGPRELLADTHYGSADNMVEAERRGTALVAPAMTAKGKKQGHRTLEDFTLDKEGRIERCPEGHVPVDTRVSKTRLQATFDASVCARCPAREHCVAYGKRRYQYTHDRVQTRRRRLAEEEPSFKERYRWRAGIEGSVSRYKHQMNMGALRVRGRPSVGYVARLRALGLNIFRVAAWRRSSFGKEPAVA